jgi:hypothetical protein
MKHKTSFAILLVMLACLCLPSLGLAQTCSNEHSLSTPSSDFEQYADGTALHKPTGLIWKRCQEGQDWDSATLSCTGTIQSYTWQAALQTAQDSIYARHSDWRLPNIKELQSIVENACIAPAINLEVFPDTSRLSLVWSSSEHADFPDYFAWYVGFSSGSANFYYKSGGLYVRLVRNGQNTCFGKPATLLGTNKADKLYGTAGKDVIAGLGGNDVIYGKGGNDVICGGKGDDKLYGEAGNDKLDGGKGKDTLNGGYGIDRCLKGEKKVGCE